MYALSLGFIIFVSIAADVQIQTIQYAKQQSHGVFMEVRSYSSLADDGSVISLRKASHVCISFAAIYYQNSNWKLMRQAIL